MTSQIRDRVGTELAEGRYRVIARIGEGSMGHVYRAHDRNLGTDVVIKFPVAPEGSVDSASFLERFARESRAMIRLSHPHVVKVIDVGEDAGLPYVVMAHLDGGSLKDRLRPANDGEPRPTAPEALHGWLMDVARALDFVHAQGHIHRDVKPANILFDRHGHAFLADFGVIKPLGGPDEEAWQGRSALTAPGYLLGTPNYVAPELVMGEACDGRVDQYALALTVHEALTGWNCMEGPTPSATLVNQTKVAPPTLGALVRDVPRTLSQAVLRGLAKEPKDRFESCSALARAILADVPFPVPGRALATPSPVSAASKGVSGRVPCPACGGLLPVVAEHAGRRVTCTRCRAVAVVQVVGGTVQLRPIAPPPRSAETDPSMTPVLYGPEPRSPSGPPTDAEFDVLPPSKGSRAARRARIGLAVVGLVALGTFGPWLVGGGLPFGGSRRDPATAPVVAAAAIELNIAYGTEKKKWLIAAAEAFAKIPEGRGIKINLIGRGSVQGAEDVLGGPRPLPIHVWSPASSAYRDAFERRWRDLKPGGRSPVLRAQNLVLTPMVFAFWKDRHDAFLRKYPRVDFKSLGEAMQEPGGWAAIAGKPEWGQFRFAHTDPARSNSGLMTLVLMAYEFAGKDRRLTEADLARADFRSWFDRFERGLTRQGALTESTGTLMEEMVVRGPSQYDCLVLYENLAIDFMKAAEASWGELRVVYPSPNLWNEHPYYILDVPWSDAPHQAAASAFLEYLMTEPVQRQALRLGFRPGNPALSARSPEGPLTKMERYGIKLEIPRVAEPPRADVVADLLAAFRQVEP